MKAAARWKALRITVTSLNLFAAWVLLTGTIELRSSAAGIVLSVLVAYFTYNLFFHETEAHRRILLPRIHLLAVFLILVLLKMYLASFVVAWDVVRGRINPRIVHFRTRLKSDVARVMLTNVITLIPGTITLNLDDDHLIVHWLDAQTTHSKHAGEVIMGSLERLLQRIWI
jgi:multicomponent Na+:H+ antiporter subunit E